MFYGWTASERNKLVDQDNSERYRGNGHGPFNFFSHFRHLAYPRFKDCAKLGSESDFTNKMPLVCAG